MGCVASVRCRFPDHYWLCLPVRHRHGMGGNDPTPALKGAFTAPKVKHRAALLELLALGGFLRVSTDSMAPRDACSPAMLPILFTRPGELRKAERVRIQPLESPMEDSRDQDKDAPPPQNSASSPSPRPFGGASCDYRRRYASKLGRSSGSRL